MSLSQRSPKNDPQKFYLSLDADGCIFAWENYGIARRSALVATLKKTLGKGYDLPDLKYNPDDLIDILIKREPVNRKDNLYDDDALAQHLKLRAAIRDKHNAMLASSEQDRIINTNPGLVQLINKIIKEHPGAEIILGVGSNRQSRELDDFNKIKVGFDNLRGIYFSESIFTALHLIKNAFQKTVKITVDEALLSDVLHQQKLGYNFNHPKSKTFCPLDETKFLLHYFQVHHAAKMGVKGLYFLDDRNDILDPLAQITENSPIFPAGVKLHYVTYNGNIQRQKQSEGTGPIDPNPATTTIAIYELSRRRALSDEHILGPTTLPLKRNFTIPVLGSIEAQDRFKRQVEQLVLLDRCKKKLQESMNQAKKASRSILLKEFGLFLTAALVLIIAVLSVPLFPIATVFIALGIAFGFYNADGGILRKVMSVSEQLRELSEIISKLKDEISQLEQNKISIINGFDRIFIPGQISDSFMATERVADSKEVAQSTTAFLATVLSPDVRLGLMSSTLSEPAVAAQQSSLSSSAKVSIEVEEEKEEDVLLSTLPLRRLS